MKIYLDYNASTPIAPEVRAALQPYLYENYGNPSSRHWAADEARAALQRARRQVAGLLGCVEEEIVFTSGGTEANNHALKGAFFARKQDGCAPHIVTSQVEHPAVDAVCEFVESNGGCVTRVPVDHQGLVDPDDVAKSIKPETVLVSIMHANNEVGTVQPLQEISQITRSHKVLFHTDAAQSAGKLSVRVDELGVDLLSIAGHKLYAPKGVGVLYIRRGTNIEPLLHGARHEGGHRAGTENVPWVVALGAACELATKHSDHQRQRNLRDQLHRNLLQVFGERLQLNGHPERRLPNTLNVSVRGMVGSQILEKVPEIAASTGSACHSGKRTISKTLRAMAVSDEVGLGALRFSIGRLTTDEDIHLARDLLLAAFHGAPKPAARQQLGGYWL